MDDRDMSKAEAIAALEAFMGPDWRVHVWAEGTAHLASMYPRHAVNWTLKTGNCMTYRDAANALKAQWRKAIRPWCLRTVEEASNSVVSWESGGGDRWAYQDGSGNPIDPEDIVNCVLKELSE